MKDWTGNSKSAFVCNGASNHSLGERQCDDYYATEPKAIHKLCAVEKFTPMVWECACGGGHIAEALKENGYTIIASDIVNRGYKGTNIGDFLQSTITDYPWDIITNPPYKHAKEFVEHALKIVGNGRKVAMFLKLTFLESKSRKVLFEKYPPKKVWVFSERIQCAKNGDFEKAKKDGTAVAYAWFVWEKGYSGEYEKVCENTEASRVWKSTSKYIDGIKEIAYGIDYSILDEFCRICKKIYVYIWCSKKQILLLMNYFVGNKGCRFEILTWHKTNPIPTCNNKYLSDTEYCLMFREEGTYVGGNMKSKGKYHESISEEDGFWVSPINTTDKGKFAHPTIKPLEFVSNHILNSTNENDIVLDPFMGSGTTAVACKNLGRQFIGFEINPKWHKIAEDRLNNIQANGQISMFRM